MKVLDFGLAKLAEPASGFRLQASGLSQSPTITSPAMTMGGVILGTAAYMSPEQAKGLPADHRSDIFAFGVVLYEMLTGRRPFQGETAPEVLASVMVRDPDLRALPSNLSQRLVELIHRCLEKNPKRRWQAIGDVAAEIERVSASPYAGATSTLESQTSRWRRALQVVAVAGIAAAAAAAMAWHFKPAPSNSVARLSIALGREMLPLSGRRLLSISPDGQQVAYVADQRIFIRSIAEFSATAIPGTDLQQGVLEPTFSPDGRHIVFWAPTGSRPSFLTSRRADA